MTFHYGKGEVWAWPVPTDGSGVPDYPPFLVGHTSSEALEAEPTDDSGPHPDVCVRCMRATHITTTEDGEVSEWLISAETPLDCDHITRDGRR